MASTQPPPYNPNDPAYPPGYQQPPPQGAAYPPPQGAAYPPPSAPYPPQTQYGFQEPPPPKTESTPQAPLLSGNQGENVGFTSHSRRDPEAGGFSATPASFDDKAVRHAFIQKVYLILTAQLTVTFGITCFFFFHVPTRDYIQSNQWLYWVSYGIFLVTYISLICCGNVRRNYPTNLIALCIFTLAMSYMVGAITSFYAYRSNGLETVIISLGICVGVVLSVSIFACQTRWDFTGCGGFLFVFSMGLFIFGFVVVIMAATGNSSKILYTVYAWLAAILFTMFLVYDTQMIVGGRKHEISAEEYIYGALQLYIDIVYLFLIILSLVGGSNN